MPKHTIEFNLPEEREELEMTMNAGKYYSCLSQLNSLLRKNYKYSDKQFVTWEEIGDIFHEILEGQEVNLD